MLMQSAGLRYQLSVAEANRQTMQQQRIETHLATAEGRYDFVTPGYLNTLYPEITVASFQAWLLHIWGSVP